MPKEKSVLITNFNLLLFYVNPYLGNFVLVQKLPVDNIGLLEL